MHALSLLSPFVVDPLGSKSTVERICEHVFEERSGLLYLLSVANWSGRPVRSGEVLNLQV